jgi:hypothetical protein
MELEEATGTRRIDPRVKAAGWTVLDRESSESIWRDRLAIGEFETDAE